MKLGTTYICVKDMEKSLKFYRSLLQKEPLYRNDDRWIAFDCGNQIALYNKKYDEKLLEDSKDIHFNKAYIDDFYKEDGCRKNNIVIFNFEVEDLKSEYKRLKDLNIGEVSDIMYVNVHMPYYYFNIIDPDGNILEITGNYEILESKKRMEDKKILLDNIDKIHTTEMGVNRIKRNLKIDTDDVVEYCKNKMMEKNNNIYKQGKNWYCEVGNIKITINSYSYTIITAHIVK